ncbi:MAG: class 1 fructose-bisphosphatase [Acidobacteria bacterium]|nr:class 1 fructose-bisphosphatase [Acidobacteriota bacterium]
MGQKLVTIQRHILEGERRHPHATGDFTGLLWDLTLAAKIISREVNKAGLAEVLGLTGTHNIHGDEVTKLDVFAHDVIYRAMDHGGHLCIMASEERDDIIPIPSRFPKGKYVLLFDPLDGSSNIDANVSVGTIFSIYRKKTAGSDGTLEDCLRKGIEQIAAGYIVYGSSTMLVYSSGSGVHGFTLDPAIGEFLLSHPNILMPKKGKIYSVNEGNARQWDAGTRSYIEYLKETDPPTARPYSLRYVGSLVADFHRNLLYGGIFLYPASYKKGKDKPQGKLRLLYEASPLAFLVEQAGGLATTGQQRILDIEPEHLHQRVPLIIGSEQDVLQYQSFLADGGRPSSVARLDAVGPAAAGQSA